MPAACDSHRDERKPNITASEVRLHQTNQGGSGMRLHTSANESATSQSYKEEDTRCICVRQRVGTKSSLFSGPGSRLQPWPNNNVRIRQSLLVSCSELAVMFPAEEKIFPAGAQNPPSCPSTPQLPACQTNTGLEKPYQADPCVSAMHRITCGCVYSVHYYFTDFTSPAKSTGALRAQE